MKGVLLIFCLLISSAFAGDFSHLDEIEKGKLVVGKELKAKDLKGKVIIFKYWGFN